MNPFVQIVIVTGTQWVSLSLCQVEQRTAGTMTNAFGHLQGAAKLKLSTESGRERRKGRADVIEYTYLQSYLISFATATLGCGAGAGAARKPVLNMQQKVG